MRENTYRAHMRQDIVAVPTNQHGKPRNSRGIKWSSQKHFASTTGKNKPK